MKKIYLKDENSTWKEFDYELLSELSEEFKKRNIKIGAWAKIGALAKIEADNCFFAVNLYKYSCGAWVESRRGEMIQLGCFTRTREEWEKDFWNNPKEFPNDNSEKSNARLRAFKMCCYFLDLIKN